MQNRDKVRSKYRTLLKDTRIIVMCIADHDQFMGPALLELRKVTVTR